MRIIYLITLCALVNTAVAKQNQPLQPLSIGFTTMIRSRILHEKRTINIYLPQGYKRGDTTRYPVIYVPDGGLAEDFLHIAGLVQYSSQSWVHRLPRSIVVGIENTSRQRDFTFAVKDLSFLAKVGYKKTDIPLYGGSENYISFLEKELLPYIQANFKTNGHNSVIGESLAGLLVTELYVNKRNLFDNFIIISPSLWWGNEKLLNQLGRAQPNGKAHKVKVYIGAALKSEDTLMYNEAVRLMHAIRATAGNSTVVYFDYLPGETHATVIHQATYNAFKLMIKK